jgi:hypothetical protein
MPGKDAQRNAPFSCDVESQSQYAALVDALAHRRYRGTAPQLSSVLYAAGRTSLQLADDVDDRRFQLGATVLEQSL